MKYKPIHILLMVLLSGAVYAQQVTEIEYFFNSDPGLGNGTAVSFAPAAVVETSFTANTSSINPGVNNLFVRAKDSTNQWSLYTKRTVYIIDGTLTNTPDITEIEYFFDEDPGFGNGTSYSFSPDSIVELSFATDLSDLSPGIHNLFVRAKDGLNRWSIYSKRTLYIIQGTIIETPEITEVEYFIDEDPGFGNATAVPITPNPSANFSFTADLPELTPGIHNIFVRAKDELERWSLYTKKTIYVIQGSGANSLPNIVAIEYFYGDDPGFGNGIPVPLNEFNDTIEMTFDLEVFGLTPGEHFLYVRAMDANNRWSLYSMDTIVVSDLVNNTLEITNGWSGISSYINPSDANIESIFADIQSKLIILQNGNGMYWPGQNVNTLGNWNMDAGYKIKVTENVNLNVLGSRLQNQTLLMQTGWNLIPVLSECNADVSDLFAGSNVSIVKEVAGWRIYWPEFGINTLEALEPGKAYFVLMDEEENLVFPECNGLKVSKNLSGIQDLSSMVPWKIPIPSAITHTIAIPTLAVSEIQSGDILGAFDEAGNCYGTSLWNAENTSITLFGDDPTTMEKDGFTEGETLEFSLWTVENEEVLELEVSFDSKLPNNELIFRNHGLSAMAGLKLSATGLSAFSQEMDIQIIPNPARDAFVLSLEPAEFEKGSLTIRNLEGQVVRTESISQSETRVAIDQLKAGVYLLEIEINEIRFIRRLIKH